MTDYVNDQIRKMGWWIYARDPWQQYQVVPEGFQICNGGFAFNRVLHGPPGPCEVLAGDWPQIKLTEAPSWQYGDLSLGLAADGTSKWCHRFDHVVATYDPGRMLYELSDTSFPGQTLRMDVLPLADAPGFIAKIIASQPSDLLWAYGGLTYQEGSVQAQGPMPGGFRPLDLQNNRYEIWDQGVRVTHPALPHTACIGSRPGSEIWLGGVPDPSYPITNAMTDGDRAALAVGRVRVSDEPVFIVACIATVSEMFWPLMRLLAFPEQTFDAAMQRYREVQSHAVVHTPDLLLDQAIKGISSSLEGCWLPPSFTHGAVRWGMQAKGWWLGWRGWYGPTAFGWYERVASAARFHAQYRFKSQHSAYVGRGKIYDVVGLDGRHDLWDDGNMGEVYLDQLYHFYCWTGDKELLRELYPAIRDLLAWERRTLDSDGDGLYENHINTWISDGHWYCGGPGAQSSAYMYRANLLAAEAAAVVGDDPGPYRAHAAQIKDALNRELWLADRGHYAEYRELLGDQRLHDAAELPTVYHPIDSDVADPFQAYQSLRYAENRLWMPHDLLLVNDWYPVIVTNGTIAYGEILHTALCYFRLGDVLRAWRLMRSALDNFIQARVPGTISQYAGETGYQGVYIDFTDSSSMFARVIVEGVFGIMPRKQDSEVTIQPGFPPAWPNASIELRDIAYHYRRDGTQEVLKVKTTGATCKIIRLIARYDQIEQVLIDGQPALWTVDPGIGRSFVVVEIPHSEAAQVTIAYRDASHQVSYDPIAAQGDRIKVYAAGCELEGLHDPQGVLTAGRSTSEALEGCVAANFGHHTFFVRLSHGNTASWAPVDVEVRAPIDLVDPQLRVPRQPGTEVCYAFTLRNNRATAQRLDLGVILLGQKNQTTVELMAFSEAEISFAVPDATCLTPGVTPFAVDVTGDWNGRLTGELRLWRLFEGLADQLASFQSRCLPVPLAFNDRLEDIFTHEYHNPRPPQWAVQIDAHALNAWTGTWYDPQCINAEHLRASLTADGTFLTDIGVPFHQVLYGPNGLFVSRWERFPDRVSIPIQRDAAEMYLLLAGSSLNNQTYMANGRVIVQYADGTQQVTDLVNPTNYDHVLQHFSDNYPQWIGGEKDGYYVVGGGWGSHADILNIPLAGKEVLAIEIECLSHEIIIGVLGLTLVV